MVNENSVLFGGSFLSILELCKRLKCFDYQLFNVVYSKLNKFVN